MITIFHGNNAETHDSFQAWRKANVDGFHMSQSAAAEFTIHYTQDKRENAEGRGCMHQGCSSNAYLEYGCATSARKVCSNSLTELMAWASEHGFTTKNCKHCDSKRFPFAAASSQNLAGLVRASDMSRDVRLAEEVNAEAPLIEGAVCRVVVNAYERNPRARALCIAHHGASCAVCGFNFGSTYGPLADGFIHVHHTRPLSEIGEQYEVDPVADLRPVCPNCHAVFHLGGECRSIEEVRQRLRNGMAPGR